MDGPDALRHVPPLTRTDGGTSSVSGRGRQQARHLRPCTCAAGRDYANFQLTACNRSGPVVLSNAGDRMPNSPEISAADFFSTLLPALSRREFIGLTVGAALASSFPSPSRAESKGAIPYRTLG